MTSVTLSGGDKLERKLAAIASKIARPFALRVGFLEGATYPDGTSVATVAAINNFGAPAAGIPARPFFTDMINEKSGAWGEAFANRLIANEWDLEKSLNQMGAGIAGQLRQSIQNTTAPPNSPVTNLLKQRFPLGNYGPSDVWKAFGDVASGEDNAPAGKPLIWSGTLYQSVEYEVESDGTIDTYSDKGSAAEGYVKTGSRDA